MEFNNKTYRNLESQVGYLTDVAEQLSDRIEEVAANIPSKMIVEELPDTGDPLITYYVGPKGTDPNYYYEVWVWVQEEPDGPFVWRELEDTDQVDLSGYLPIQEDPTTYDQVYGKAFGGTQMMYDIGQNNATANSIVRRTAQGRVIIEPPNSDYHAVNLKYANEHYVPIYNTPNGQGITKGYVVNPDGSQGMFPLALQNTPLTFACRDSNGRLRASSPSGQEGTELVTVNYAENNYVVQDKGGVTSYYHIYCKNPDGTQGWLNGALTPVANAVPIYRSSGTLRVGTPIDNADAASKAYVDAAVGQLMYLHDIDLAITIDSTNKLFIKAYLINGSSTAITTFDRIVYKQLDVQWGGFGPSSDNATPAAITKMPDSFRQDDFDEPLIGFLYQYFSGGNLVSARTTSSMTTTVTDVVTTW